MLRTRMERLFGTVDQMMNDIFKVTETSILDAIGSMDEETAAMVMPACKMYTESKAMSLEMADMMDRQAIQMEQVLKMNSKLLEQVKELRVEQGELIREIKELKEQGKSCNCGKQEEKK